MTPQPLRLSGRVYVSTALPPANPIPIVAPDDPGYHVPGNADEAADIGLVHRAAVLEREIREALTPSYTEAFVLGVIVGAVGMLIAVGLAVLVCGGAH